MTISGSWNEVFVFDWFDAVPVQKFLGGTVARPVKRTEFLDVVLIGGLDGGGVTFRRLVCLVSS